jgi:hypothetical protein
VNHWTGYAPGHSGDKLKHTIEQALKIAKQTQPTDSSDKPTGVL